MHNLKLPNMQMVLLPTIGSNSACPCRLQLLLRDHLIYSYIAWFQAVYDSITMATIYQGFDAIEPI